MTRLNGKKGAKGLIILKLDLEKAYDRLEWSFINMALQAFSFPENFIKIIMECITSPRYSALLNGGRLDWFCPSRGIRQGDPISPYLFLICMEFLSALIEDEVQKGEWKGIRISRNSRSISHLLFADDILLFGDTDERTVLAIQRVLKVFCEASGQRVSVQKSKLIFSKNTPQVVRDRVQGALNIPMSESLGTYLGVPMDVTHTRASSYNFLIDKFKQKLTSWQGRYLSSMGRVTLINSVLNSLPTHVMQCTMLPQKVCLTLDRINRDFLWGSSENQRTFHAINWDVVTRPREQGGLGICKTEGRNLALLGSFAWRAKREDRPWAQILRAKYLN